MATIVDERAPIRGRRMATAGLTTLALLLVAGLGIWQMQSADAPAPGVEPAEEFSPEAVRVRNTAGLYVKEAFSPEAVRIANTSGLYQREAFSPEAVRMRNWESFLVGAN
ncbi:MAG: hypothetical protein ABW021_04685 [Acidimicrobiia bacterium]